ncbi:hypothetical protein ACFSPU_01365 [Haoranjiania flava]|uniref:Uncharacterized protein n=1 Tax=Haoranjiania flava TaxID=1856322 RepID=A0AAE3IMN2_9BACT|nr:hypothetical protein [Haoranjiania flava]MCU7693860.1 hypothetical protein [Haoranjiania flava]
MNTRFINIFSILTLLFLLASCKKTEWIEYSGSGPQINISKEYENIKGINVGDEVTIPVSLLSEAGIKRFSYFFITQTANGTRSETPVNVDFTNFPTSVQQEIVFKIAPSMLELVIVSFDKNNYSSEVHITMAEIRELPVLSFKDGIKYQATVFENKKLLINGNITSKYDLASISYKTLKDGVVSQETPIAFSDKKSTSFSTNVLVSKSLTAIILSAKNIYGGTVVDTFKIGAVVDDAISITLTGNITSIANLYVDSTNKISGNISSGSDISSLSYAIKQNGTYTAEQNLQPGTPPDDFKFEINYTGALEIQAIRISATNQGGKMQVIELPVLKVNRRLLRFRDIVLTTEIGPGKNNWFSAYKSPHVFDVTNAAAAQDMIDFGSIIYNNAFRFVPPYIFTAGAAYKTAVAPYMAGFTKATYTMVTANRRSVTPAALDTLIWDSNLDNYINVNIKGPAPIGENYNITTTNRRISGDPVIGTGFIFGWGSWDVATGAVNNQAFGLALVKAYTNAGSEKGTVVLDIVVPAEDMRTKFNPVSLFNYP